MAGGTGTEHLSEEAQRAIQAAEERARQAEERATKLSERVERLTGTVQSGTVKEYLGWLRSDEGLGLSEDRGFGGVLSEIEQQMLADDGEPALQGDHFAQDGNTSGELSYSEGLKRIFGALHKATEGKKRLGEALSQPADEEPNKDDFELDEKGEIKLDADGKRIPKAGKDEGGTNAGETSGKPGAGSGDDPPPTIDKQLDELADEMPGVASLMGRSRQPAGAGSSTSGGDA